MPFWEALDGLNKDSVSVLGTAQMQAHNTWFHWTSVPLLRGLGQ